MLSDVILLVDDNDDDVYLTVQAFRKNNINNEIVVARDGLEAIDLLLPTDDRPPLLPAIVLLDINMPRMGGLEVLAALRAQALTRSLPVIMLTTSAEDSDVVDSYDNGANGYVRKPVTTAEFLEAARVLGVYWLDLNIAARPGAS